MEAEMKVILAAFLLVAFVAAANEAVIQPDPQPEARMVVAQRFCPNGRC
jgi:hypothetical protein